MHPSADSEVSNKAQPTPHPSAAASSAPITLYHWLVVILAAGGWLFDCMGQRIFVLSREPALRELLGATASDDDVRWWGGVATMVLMFGWATGGILFGLLSDHYGRVRAMVSTLLAYTVFSGLSGFAHGAIAFLVWRLLFGVGVGGMFGAATTLVAESVPPRVRTVALGSLQALSSLGTMLASWLSLGITPGRENYWGHFSGWQVLCFAGVLPVVLAVPMILILKEPEAWKRAKAEAVAPAGGKSVGSLADLFRHPRWRRHMLVGVCLGVAGMVGLWGIAFFSPELITTAFKNHQLRASDLLKPAELCAALNDATHPAVARLKARLKPEVITSLQQVPTGGTAPPATLEAVLADLNRVIQHENLYDTNAFQSLKLKKSTQNLIQLVEREPERKNAAFLNRQLLEQMFPGAIRELQRTIDRTRSRGTMLQDVGAVLGMFSFTFAAGYFNRRAAFLGAFVVCLGVVGFVFASLETAADVDWMLPLLGFATLAPFAGYSIYFPELFPTRLRGTGVGFCYNTVRYLAAPFPFLLGWLSTLKPFRTVAVMMCGIYVVGLAALFWAPETKGQPLPED
jgi:MFS family permease